MSKHWMRDVIQTHFSAAIKDGRLQHGDVRNPQVRFISYLQRGGENAQHVLVLMHQPLTGIQKPT